MPHLNPLASAVLLAAACTTATAQTPAAAPAADGTLAPVTVRGDAETGTGPVQGYVAKRSATATKTDTPLRETPQAVTVVPRQRIEDMAASNLQDALTYAAGVRSDAFGLDSRTDSILIRGTEPAIYLDGLRQQLGGYYTSVTRTDPYTLERIEVLRGPSGMLFGQGSTGGLINQVSKLPQAQAQREVSVQLGNFNRRELQADLTGPLTADGQWLYRIVAVARKADTQVDHVPDDRLLLAPSVTWKPDARTTLTLQGLTQRDRTGSTLQFLPWSGTGAPNPNGLIPTNRFIGEPGVDHYDSNRDTFGWLFEHRFNDQWTLRQNLRYSRNRVDSLTFYPDSYSNPGNSYVDAAQRQLDRFHFGGDTRMRQLATDQHLQGDLRSGNVQHKLLVGLDAVRSRQTGITITDGPARFGGTLLPIDVFTPVYTGVTLPAPTVDPVTTQTHAGLYLQDQMKFGDDWILVAGLRHDRATSGLENAPDEDSRATTKRLGAMRLLPGGWSPYLSYSESFTPVAGVNLAGVRYKPQRGKQVEAGVKLQPDGAGYSFNAAVFKLREQNRLVPDPGNPLNNVQAGRTNTQGLELEWAGALTPAFELAAHYNYLKIEGSRDDPNLTFGGNPPHQAAVWGKYRFSVAGVAGWSAAAGLRYFSRFQDGPAPVVPALRLLDLALGFDSGAWRYALNVQNATDKVYNSTCAARGDCFFGARRTVVASVTHRF